MSVFVGASSSNDNFKNDVQFIKTTYRDDIEVKTLFSSVEELNEFYEKYNDLIFLEHREKVYADSTIGFLDAIKYMMKIFLKKIVLS